MRLLMLLISLVLFGCGSDTSYMLTTQQTTTYQAFEGVYHFEYGGFLEITANEDSRLTIVREMQSLTSTNPFNNTLASHPAIYMTNLKAYDGVISFFMNVNYNEDTNDIEEDATGDNIDGSRRTDFELRLVNSKLQLTIRIYDGPINDLDHVVATRVLTSL